MRDAAGELLLQVAAGEISVEDAQREVDTCKALIELIMISTNMAVWPCPPEEKMRREGAVIVKRAERGRRGGGGGVTLAGDKSRASPYFFVSARETPGGRR